MQHYLITALAITKRGVVIMGIQLFLMLQLFILIS